MSLSPNAGVPEDRGNLIVEAATERQPGRRQPQAERDSQPEGVTEGEHSEDGGARQTE